VSRLHTRGLTTVEFTAVAAMVMVVVIGCLEIGRMLFVWNTLGECTRRGARLAAVCPLDVTQIQRVAVFSTPDGSNSSPYIAGLNTGHVTVQYLNEAGTPGAVSNETRYVTVSISGYQHRLMVPFVARNIEVSPFRTTVPVEGLRQCFGS
jgi:Flp pilus assembly protein TadG